MANKLSEFERERGYSKEEKYFYDLNRELIAERQRRREAAIRQKRMASRRASGSERDQRPKGFIDSFVSWFRNLR